MQSLKGIGSEQLQAEQLVPPSHDDRSRRNMGVDQSSLRFQIRHLWMRIRNSWCIGCSAFRSLRGRIQIQLTTKLPYADLGPALQQLPNGHFEPTARTLSRSYYTQMLEATHSWVDIVDIQIFLMGFDAGEQWALRNGIETGKYVEPAWLHLAKEENKHAL